MIEQITQFKKLVTDSRNVLVVFGETQIEDSISSALALRNFFIKQGKKVDIVSAEAKKRNRLDFLPGFTQINPAFSGLQKFIVKVNVSKVKMKNLSYDIKDGWLSVYLTPEEGSLTPQDIRTAQTGYKYDLIITLNTPELDALGELFFNNTDLFYQTPVVNIDCQPSNEHFGKINMVEITATSVAEVVFHIMEQINDSFIDEETATCLLTGMIAGTGSFKTKNVTPKTLKTASRLLNLGAKREKIIKQLYQTKTIASLKLWGIALSRLKNDSTAGLVWTVLTEQDFVNAGAGSEHLDGLISEIADGSPEAKNVLVIYEEVTEGQKKIMGRLLTDKNFDAVRLTQKYQPIGSGHKVKFNYTGNSISEAEKDITEEIIKKINNILKTAN